MTKRQSLGEFEHLLLVAVMRLGEDAYGVSMKQEIEERTGRPVTLGAIYPTMDRLEARGFVTSEMGESTSTRGGRSKRMFRITPAGIEAAQQAYGVFQAMWDGLEPAGRGDGTR